MPADDKDADPLLSNTADGCNPGGEGECPPYAWGVYGYYCTNPVPGQWVWKGANDGQHSGGWVGVSVCG